MTALLVTLIRILLTPFSTLEMPEPSTVKYGGQKLNTFNFLPDFSLLLKL